MRPFQSLCSLRSPDLDEGHFVYDYLLHCYSLAKKMGEAPAMVMARRFVATANAEENTLRELTRMRPRYPSIARLTASMLRDIHVRNSDQFGTAANRYERELLTLVQRSLEAALVPIGSKPSTASTPAVSIACQQMVGASYDPAAALVVIANSMSTESVPTQGLLHSTIIGIVDTLDRPAMCREGCRILERPGPRRPAG